MQLVLYDLRSRDHHHHYRQLINVPTAGAQAFLILIYSQILNKINNKEKNV
jgi:hypothetical protein